ncbi:exodeoxyribonuclease VII large subunit, partial [Sandaracinobacter sp. RS1-74]|uniref:exodeoxyribonuclease VII large subunit n=1 Tax=Sandaracinobacteroides sayramensis TaxID=2913411 RepID=UPI002342C64E
LRGERLAATAARLPRPATLAGLARQRLDEAGERLPRALAGRARLLRTRLQAMAERLTPRLLQQRVTRERARLDAPRVTPNPALIRARIAHARAALESGFRLAEGLSPQAVLARGFALVRRPDGEFARRLDQAAPEPHLTLVFADGELGVTPADRPPPIAPAPRRPGPSGGSPPAGQGQLF